MTPAERAQGVRRRDPDPARGRRGARADHRRRTRADPARGAGARDLRRPARARARRAGLDARRVVRGRGAVRALDQRALLARPDRLQRARPRLAGADRPLAAAGAARRAARRLRGHRGARGLRPVGDHDDRDARRRRLAARRREVVRDLRRRRGGLHRDGAGAVEPTLFLVEAGLPGISRRRRPAVHPHLSARPPDDPLRGRRASARTR